MLPPLKVIFKFFAVLVVLGALLFPAWPFTGAVHRGYASYFRWFGNAAFSRVGSEGAVRFLPMTKEAAESLPPWLAEKMPKAEGVMDTVLVLERRDKRGAGGYFRTSSGRIGYAPTAVLAAMALATPVALRKRLIGLGIGLILVHVFIWARLYVTVIEAFCGDKPYALYHPTGFWSSVIHGLQTTINDDPTVSYVVPVFIWFLILFRPSQWQAVKAEQDVENTEA